MNKHHRAIRALLTTMSPNRATDYIKSFNLRADEERFLIDTDVYGKSLVETAMDYNVCPETVRNKRKAAYMKIADEINNRPHANV